MLLSPASGHVICIIHLMSHMSDRFVWIIFQVTCLSDANVFVRLVVFGLLIELMQCLSL